MYRTADFDTIPSGWQMARLGDVASIAFSSVDKKTLDGEQPVKLCNYTDVFYNRRIHSGIEFMTASASPREFERWNLKRGDVLFTKDSEVRTEIGVPAYVTEDLPNVLCGYHLGMARPHIESIDGSFLARVLASGSLSNQFARIANGVTRFGLTLEATRAITLPLPPLREQQAIAYVLDRLEDALEHTEEVIRATGQLCDSLLSELLSRGIPSWHREGQHTRTVGAIPRSWRMVRMDEVAEVNPRRPRLTIDLEEMIPFVPMAAVAEQCRGLNTRHYRPYGDVNKGYTYFEEDDVLFAKITPCMENRKHVLAGGLKNGFGFGTTEFHVLRAGPAIEPRYLYRTVTQPMIVARCARNFSGTAGQQRVQPEVLRALPIPLPPLTEQRAISSLLDSVDITIQQSFKSRDSLEMTMLSLSESLLSGSLRVEGL